MYKLLKLSMLEGQVIVLNRDLHAVLVMLKLVPQNRCQFASGTLEMFL